MIIEFLREQSCQKWSVRYETMLQLIMLSSRLLTKILSASLKCRSQVTSHINPCLFTKAKLFKRKFISVSLFRKRGIMNFDIVHSRKARKFNLIQAPQPRMVAAGSLNVFGGSAKFDSFLFCGRLN